MKNKLSIMVITVCILLTQGTIYAGIIDRPPSKSIVLKLPNNDYANWKEIARSVTKQAGIVELIPFDQTTQNWSELISILYSEKDKSEDKMPTIEIMLDRIRDGVLASYPGNKVTWRIIEKNQQDCLYEWILHEPYKDLPPYHEIARIFTTAIGFHRIGFSRQHSEMSVNERKKWIGLFKESASLVSMKEAASISNGISMADRFKDSLDLGPIFQSWGVDHTYMFDNGCTQVCRIPASQVPSTKIGHYLTECLESITAPVLDTSSVDKLFEIEKELVRTRAMRNVKFHILKKTPNEIIYYYSYPKDHVQLTAVVRTFIERRGYYSISYKRGLTDEMNKENILQWAKQLQIIKIADRARHK